MHLNICSRHNKQTTFSEQKENINWIWVEADFRGFESMCLYRFNDYFGMIYRTIGASTCVSDSQIVNT